MVRIFNGRGGVQVDLVEAIATQVVDGEPSGESVGDRQVDSARRLDLIDSEPASNPDNSCRILNTGPIWSVIKF